MSAWMNESPNHNGNGFPLMTDPSAAPSSEVMMDPSAFMGSPAQFNQPSAAGAAGAATQFPGQPPNMMTMGNGAGPMRYASPSAFQHNAYQTNPVVPSKRPRPRDDSIAGSPRPNPGIIPTTRSDTPTQQQQPPPPQPSQQNQQHPQQQQAFNTTSASTNSAQFPTSQPQNPSSQASPYPPHLGHNGSTNATPSPMMSNQPLRPGSVPQRMATASPHPFSPSHQQLNTQGSPAPSDHGTPQPPNPYMQNMQQQASFNPTFNASSPSQPRPSPGPSPASISGQSVPQQPGQQQMYQQPQAQGPRNSMDQQQKMAAAYQMRLQQQLQAQGMPPAQAQAQAQAQGRPGSMPPSQPPHQSAGMMNGQPGTGMRPQQRLPQRFDPEVFMKNLIGFCVSRNLSLDKNPMIGSRHISLPVLFQQVQSRGMYKNVTATNQWPHIAQALQFHPAQVPTAPQVLKMIYEQNLLTFEEAWAISQRKTPGQGPPSVPGTPTMPGQGISQQSHLPPQHHQPQPHPQGPPHMVPLQGPPVTPSHNSKAPTNPSTPQLLTTGAPSTHGQVPGQPIPNHSRGVNQRPGDLIPGTAPGQPPFSNIDHETGGPSGAPSNLPHGMSISETPPNHVVGNGEYIPRSREIGTWGLLNLSTMNNIGFDLERMRPDYPPVQELGHIDIAALTRSLQCGMHSEIRVALDTLVDVSASMHQLHVIHLPFCEDLADALVGCAEDQVEVLLTHTNQIRDEIELPTYEKMVRITKEDSFQVVDTPKFGTPEYDMQRAVDRLICIFSIFRNLSCPGENNPNLAPLADESVINLMSCIIRYIGTREHFLRTNINTLDFFKDCIIILSNIATSLEIGSRENALSLLHLLLCFAPSPTPEEQDGTTFFPSYDPMIHPYLPHAVDALAKTLARDEPNRSHFRAIFSTEQAILRDPLNILTRAFGLAISPVPDYSKDARQPVIATIVECRKPFLMQGLLAAEMLLGMAPNHETPLVKSWLSPANGIAPSLLHLSQFLGSQYDLQARPTTARGAPPSRDESLIYLVVLVVGVLKKMVERSRDPNDTHKAVPVESLPSKDMLINTLSFVAPEWTKEGVVQQIMALSTLSL
ncbi:uncharacterized protein BROUX77_005745 [Berkeleyomyces rouxiae]|uniref:uncharacterized protein n=1 Tax=Berkeleyomyces rouxiae TaxID=2035830 RepID=UPI003B8019CD